MAGVPNLPAITAPNAQPVLGALTSLPQTIQQIQGAQEDLQQKKLETEKQRLDVNAIKASTAQTLAGNRIDALTQVIKSNPTLLAKDPNVIKEMQDAYRTKYGIDLPLAPDGTIPASLYKPSKTNADPKQKEFYDALPGGSAAKKQFYSQFYDSTPDDFNAPAALSPDKLAKIQEEYGKIGHWRSEDEIRAKVAKATELKAAAESNELGARAVKDRADAQKALADANLASVRAANVGRQIDAQLSIAKARLQIAQQRSGTAQITALHDFNTEYGRLQSTRASLVKAMSAAEGQDGFNPDDPPAAYKQAQSQLQSLDSQLQGMESAYAWSQNQLLTNAAYMTQAGTGISTGRPPEIESIGGKKTGWTPPPGSVEGTIKGGIKAWQAPDGTIYDESGKKLN